MNWIKKLLRIKEPGAKTDQQSSIASKVGIDADVVLRNRLESNDRMSFNLAASFDMETVGGVIYIAVDGAKIEPTNEPAKVYINMTPDHLLKILMAVFMQAGVEFIRAPGSPDLQRSSPVDGNLPDKKYIN